MSDELKTLHDEMSKAFEVMKANLDGKDKETADVKQTVETANKAIGDIEAKMKDLEVKLARAERPDPDSKEDEITPEEKAFVTYFRKGDELGVKALATDNDSEGGYAVPDPIKGPMIEKLLEFSPVRAEVTVETISQGNAWQAPAEGATNFAAGKVGERDARSETVSGTMRMERIPVHEFYANPFITQTMLDDSGFDINGWIARRVATRRAVLEGGYWINGTGEGEPEGLLTNSSITSVNSGDSNEVTDTGLIDVTFDLPESYARNAVFLWRRATTAKIRKFKDVTSGQYLWQPGLNGGTSPTVLGYRYVECIDMPVEATDAFPVLFGDFRAGYKIVDRKQLMLNRDPYSSKPFIEMYFTWRTGGQVVLAEAIRKLKCST